MKINLILGTLYLICATGAYGGVLEKVLEAESKEDLHEAVVQSGGSSFERRLVMFYGLSRFLNSEEPLNPDGMMKVGEILRMIREASRKGDFSKGELHVILDALKWSRTNENVEYGYEILKRETGVGPSKNEFLQEADPEMHDKWIEEWRKSIEEGFESVGPQDGSK